MRRWAIPQLLLAAAVISINPPAPALASQSLVRGFNWADARDNFQDGWVIPSGLNASDTPPVAAATAGAVVRGLESISPGQLTTIRLPINPPTVLGSWWPTYQAAIDEVLRSDKKAILACWEANKDGRIDDQDAFQEMWDVVISTYGNNPNVMFEIMNEPFGYTASEWTDIAAAWLSRSGVAPARVIVDGVGYGENVVPVGNDPRLDGTALGFHVYGFWRDHTSISAWKDEIEGGIGPFADRVIITEFGSPMTTGAVYSPVGEDGGRDVAYLQAVTDAVRSHGLGSIYWPGLRDGDPFSLTSREGEGWSTSLRVNNESAVDLLSSAWEGRVTPD
jgi:hypothetical protein